MTPASLGFHAAAGGVTGSCALLDWAGLRVLVDCGMPDDAGAGSEPFGFDPATIDVVLLTHAHYDHCGALPWLVQRGFRGRILATAATRDLVQLVLLDAAQVLHEAARSPSFDAHDVEAVMTRFDPPVVPGTLVALAPGLSASFHDAGHILGSASVRLQGADGDGGSASVAFSGDLGHAGRPLLDAPDAPPPSDVAVIETTYGDRLHRPLAASIDALHDAVAATLARGGQVVIPAFALERAQEILYYLREGVASGRLPAEVPVYLDSPMAIAATALFGRHRDACGARLRAMFDDGDDPFGLPGLQMARTPEASSKIHRGEAGRQPAVIIAGSGMCTGGRVLHHLARLLPEPAAAVVFVGYASAGTLARRLRDGAEVVTIFGDEVPVRARRHVIDGLSAHADRAELCAWHRRVAPARTFLVHGEPASMLGLAAHLERTEVVMPGPRACYELFPATPGPGGLDR